MNTSQRWWLAGVLIVLALLLSSLFIEFTDKAGFDGEDSRALWSFGWVEKPDPVEADMLNITLKCICARRGGRTLLAAGVFGVIAPTLLVASAGYLVLGIRRQQSG